MGKNKWHRMDTIDGEKTKGIHSKGQHSSIILKKTHGFTDTVSTLAFALVSLGDKSTAKTVQEVRPVSCQRFRFMNPL